MLKLKIIFAYDSRLLICSNYFLVPDVVLLILVNAYVLFSYSNFAASSQVVAQE